MNKKLILTLALVFGIGIFAVTVRAECANGSCTPIHVGILDEVLPNQKIDMLKMDAEGSEFWIMEGAKLLLANPELILMMEWDTRHLTRNGVEVKNFITLLQESGFHAWSVAKGGKLKPVTYASLEKDATFDLVLSRNPEAF